MSDLVKMEAEVNQLIWQGNTEKAAKLLIELIENCVQAKQIGKAEKLREKLMEEVDPMALNEIVRLGELIEEAKTTGVDPAFVKQWSRLFANFSTEEKNALYYALGLEEFAANTFIFLVKEIHPKLYLISEGEAKLIFIKDKQPIDIKNLTTGEITGDHAFFNITTTTVALKTLTQVKASTIERKAFEKLLANHPGLENKIKDFCLRQEQIPDLLKSQGKDRRVPLRFNIAGRAAVTILDDNGQSTKNTFACDLSDISQGGLALYFKSPQKKAAEDLLNQGIYIEIALEKEGKKYKFKRDGVIVAVSFYMPNEYIIHQSFTTLVGEKTIAEIHRLLEDDSSLLM